MPKLLVCFVLFFSFVTNAKSARPVEPYLKKKNVYAVPQAYVEKTLGNLADVLTTARAIPYKDAKGNFNGFEIERIDRKSDLRKLGLLPGDVMIQINDVVLDNAAKGLEAFQKIRLDNIVKLHLLRKKKKVVLTYEKVI